MARAEVEETAGPVILSSSMASALVYHTFSRLGCELSYVVHVLLETSSDLAGFICTFRLHEEFRAGVWNQCHWLYMGPCTPMDIVQLFVDVCLAFPVRNTAPLNNYEVKRACSRR